MKILFLDMDGVLVTWASMSAANEKGFPRGYYVDPKTGIRSHPSDPRCVKRLNRITDETGAKIVISSCWRMFGLEVMCRYLSDQGVRGEVISLTEEFRLGKHRGDEIAAWLCENGVAEEDCVILDDMAPAHFQTRNLHLRHLWTSMAEGLEDTHVERALELLGVQTARAA